MLGLFVLVEARFARAPLVPISMFRLRMPRAANLIILLMYASQFAMWFFLTLFLQQILHFVALEAGLAFLPLTCGVVAGSATAPRLIARFGLRAALTGGLLAGSAGLALLTGVHPGAEYAVSILPGGVICTFGMGLAIVSTTIAATQGVPVEQSGLASGLLNTSRLVGGALGLAVLSTLADAYTRHQLHAAVSVAAARTDGYRMAFLTGSLFCLLAAVASAVLLAAPRRSLGCERTAGDDLEQDPVKVFAA